MDDGKTNLFIKKGSSKKFQCKEGYIVNKGFLKFSFELKGLSLMLKNELKHVYRIFFSSSVAIA